MTTDITVAEGLTQPAAKLAEIRAVLREEYSNKHQHPWIVAYSGGKDSTLVAHLVFEMLMALPPSQRTRTIHIIANDTLVESPLVVGHMTDSIKAIGDASAVDLTE